MVTIARAGPAGSQKSAATLAGAKHLGYPLQPGLELVSKWDAGITGGNFTSSASESAPIPFSLSIHQLMDVQTDFISWSFWTVLQCTGGCSCLLDFLGNVYPEAGLPDLVEVVFSVFWCIFSLFHNGNTDSHFHQLCIRILFFSPTSSVTHFLFSFW